MAVKTSVTVRCDGDGCTNYVDVERESELPRDWYRTTHSDATTGKPDRPFDFCSLKCIGKWAKARAVAIGERVSSNGRKPIEKKKCDYCDGLFAPQGMGLHMRTTHPDEYALEQATAP